MRDKDYVKQDIFDKKYPIVSKQGENGELISTIYIMEEIGAPWEFAEILAFLDTAVEGDTITFKYATPGGRLDATIALMNSFITCKAILIGHVIGEVASAGTMLLMKMDDIVVFPWGSLMIHNYSGGSYGKGGEINDRIAFETPFLKRFYRDTYKTFLTKKECLKVSADNDKYMGADEIIERWGKVIVRREKRMEEAKQKAQEDAINQGIADSREFLKTHDTE